MHAEARTKKLLKRVTRMRQQIPQEIAEMQIKQLPYLEFKEGEGLVLKPDAPQEIVESRKITHDWYKNHGRK